MAKDFLQQLLKGEDVCTKGSAYINISTCFSNCLNLNNVIKELQMLLHIEIKLLSLNSYLIYNHMNLIELEMGKPSFLSSS